MGFLKIQFVAKYQKIVGGSFGGIKKFSGKKRKMGILKQSHSSEKLERGDPLGFLKLQFAANYQRNLRGTLWRRKKLNKSLTVPKKKEVEYSRR